MTRQEAIDLMLGRIKELTMSSLDQVTYWEQIAKPVLERDLKEFVAMIERELLPIA